MKKRFLIPLVLLLGFVVFAILASFWWIENTKPVSADETKIRFVIPKGYGASQIAAKLEENNLIKDALAFKVYVQLTGHAGKIQAGEYDLSSNLNLVNLINTLLKGPSEIWVTIPEGLRKEEIALKFVVGLEKGSDEKGPFIAEFLEASKQKEGFLFPDTYLLPKDATGEKVVSILEATFNKKISDFEEDINASRHSLNQIITMASLVEREAKTDEERPIIAGILYKRYEAGWPLQVDASLQYAVASSRCQVEIAQCDNWWPILTKEDLEITSAYNTYKYPGLPTGPISNPGLASIKAAVYPQESDFWFYLHDSKGQIHYAKSLEEHNLNIGKYLGK
jgi:UPF0755 protein